MALCPPNELYHKPISVPRETSFMQTIIIFEHTDHTCIILLHFYRTSGTGTVTTMHTRIKPKRSWPFYKSSLGWQNGGRSSRHPASHLINEPHSSITNHTNTIHSCTIALARPEQLANVLDTLKRHIFMNLHIILLISILILHLAVYN